MFVPSNALSGARCPAPVVVLLEAWLAIGTSVALGQIEHEPGVASGSKVTLVGSVVDADSGQPIPARVHLRDDAGKWLLCDSKEGSAVHYRKEPANAPKSAEVHTTLSAHPFLFQGKPGRYQVRVERGKEFLPLERTINLDQKTAAQVFLLRRWINMAADGWYSGDTHVHRSMDELPNVLLAEDLNVALPLNYWVTRSGVPPAAADRPSGGPSPPRLVTVDPTHVIWPRNTEYELFTVDGKRHTQGAVFVLNHRSVFHLAAPPVRPIANLARQESALLDLDKHSWPWSLMIIPTMGVDLFELTNNHVWQTQFGFPQWTIDTVPDYMKLDMTDEGFTEQAWIDFGMQTYYALLNCGFRLRVSAGTASGVHPVQLGFGRVYVHLPDGFDYDAWMDGLNAGRSFVTTGPMLQVMFNGEHPGHTFRASVNETVEVRIVGRADSKRPLERLEVVAAGDVVCQLPVENTGTATGGFTSPIDVTIPLRSSSWVAVRCFERHPQDRIRFAHTNPVHVDIEKAPLRPRRVEVDYFVQRMREEIARNQGVLSEEAVREYQQALEIYLKIAQTAR